MGALQEPLILLKLIEMSTLNHFLKKIFISSKIIKVINISFC